MKEYIIEIQEKENGKVTQNWDYGTEEFEKLLKEAIEEKMNENKLPWYIKFFASGVSDYIGEALSEAIDFIIEKTKEKMAEK